MAVCLLGQTEGRTDGKMDGKIDEQTMNGQTELTKTINPFGILHMPGV